MATAILPWAGARGFMEEAIPSLRGPEQGIWAGVMWGGGGYTPRVAYGAGGRTSDPAGHSKGDGAVGLSNPDRPVFMSSRYTPTPVILQSGGSYFMQYHGVPG